MDSSELDILKDILVSPRLDGISNFFANLRTEIDLAFHSKSSLSQETFKQDYTQIIEYINSFEIKCNKQLKNGSFCPQLTEETNLLIDRLADCNDSYDKAYSVYKQLVKLESTLYLNQTLLFIKDKNESLFGNLLVVTNQYFGKRGVDLIKK